MQIPPIQPTAGPTGATATATTSEQKALHSAAVGFEQLLLRQLAEQLARSAESEEGEESSAAADAQRSVLPDALAKSIAEAGGIGLAASLERSLGESSR